MARSTSSKDVDVPKGMMRFRVIGATIKDSLGQYCVSGDYAVLTKTVAEKYQADGNIKVELPKFDTDEGDGSVEVSGKNNDDGAGAATPRRGRAT